MPLYRCDYVTSQCPAAGHMRISSYFTNYDAVIESLIALGTLETLRRTCIIQQVLQ